MAAALMLLVSCSKENQKEDYGLFKEPVLDWGTSRASIISKLGKPTSEDSNESMNELRYETEDILYTYYLLEDGLHESSVYLPLSVPFEDVVAFLKEKYTFREEFSSESHLYFNTKDGKTTIWVEEEVMGARGIAYNKNTGDLF